MFFLICLNLQLLSDWKHSSLKNKPEATSSYFTHITLRRFIHFVRDQMLSQCIFNDGKCRVWQKKIINVYYFMKEIDLIHIYGITRSAAFCLQSNVLKWLISIQPQYFKWQIHPFISKGTYLFDQ